MFDSEKKQANIVLQQFRKQTNEFLRALAPQIEPLLKPE